MFGINPAEMAKKELLKVDVNRNNRPDVFEALDAAEAGLESLASFLDNVDQEEAEAMLNALNQFRKPENRVEPKEISETAAKLIQVPKALREVKTILDNTEKELGKK